MYESAGAVEFPASTPVFTTPAPMLIFDVLTVQTDFAGSGIIFDTGTPVSVRGPRHKTNLPRATKQVRLRGWNLKAPEGDTHRLTDGSMSCSAGNTLISGGQACRLGGQAFAWQARKSNPHLGKISRQAEKKILAHLTNATGMHRLLTVDDKPRTFPADDRHYTVAEAIIHSVVVDSGTTHNVRRTKPNYNISRIINVEGVGGHITPELLTTRDEVLTDEGSELISLGRSCHLAGFTFVWLPFANAPFYGTMSATTAKAIADIIATTDMKQLLTENHVPKVDDEQAAKIFDDIGRAQERTFHEDALREAQTHNSRVLDEMDRARRCMLTAQSPLLGSAKPDDLSHVLRAYINLDQSSLATQYTDVLAHHGGTDKFITAVRSIRDNLAEMLRQHDPLLTQWSSDPHFAHERTILALAGRPSQHLDLLETKLNAIADAIEPSPREVVKVYAASSLPTPISKWIQQFAPQMQGHFTHLIHAQHATTLQDGRGRYVLTANGETDRKAGQIDSTGQDRLTFMVDNDAFSSNSFAHREPIHTLFDVVLPTKLTDGATRIGDSRNGATTLTLLKATPSFGRGLAKAQSLKFYDGQALPQFSHDVVRVLRHEHFGQDLRGAVTKQQLILKLPDWEDAISDPLTFPRLPALSRGRLEVLDCGKKVRARYGHSGSVPISDELIFSKVDLQRMDISRYYVHRTPMTNKTSIEQLGLTTKFTKRSHVYFRGIPDVQTLLHECLKAKTENMAMFVTTPQLLQRYKVNLLVPNGENKRGIFVTADGVPPAAFLSHDAKAALPHSMSYAERVADRPATVHLANGSIETVVDRPLYEACEEAAEILSSWIADDAADPDKTEPTTTVSANVMTRAMREREAAEAAICPEAEPSQPVRNVTQSHAVHDDIASQAHNIDDPHRFHFPRRKDCPICQQANMRRKHRRSKGQIRLGCWAVDIMHGPDDGVVLLIFVNASNSENDIQTIHCVLPASLHADAIQVALMQGLIELGWFYSIDPVRRVHCDRAPEFLAQRDFLRTKHYISLTTTQGGDSESNGTVERAVRTVKEQADTNLTNAQVGGHAWAQAAINAAFLYSRDKRWRPRATRDITNKFWMRQEVRDMQPFGAEVMAGRGSKDNATSRTRRAIYLFPSSTVSPGHHVGILTPDVPPEAPTMTPQELTQYDGPFCLMHFDDVSQIRPRAKAGNKYHFPVVNAKDGHTVIHCDDVNTLWIQCGESACRKFRAVHVNDITTLRDNGGFTCKKLDGETCSRAQDPDVRQSTLRRVGAVHDDELFDIIKKRGRPPGSTNKPKSNNKEQITLINTAKRKSKLGRPIGSRNKHKSVAVAGAAVASALLQCSEQALHDVPPAPIVAAFAAAMRNSDTIMTARLPPETEIPAQCTFEPFDVHDNPVDPTTALTALKLTHDTKLPRPPDDMARAFKVAADLHPRSLDKAYAHVYKELGIDAAHDTPGGPEAVRKELSKYLTARSLGRPIDKRGLPSTAIIYKARLLFGQKGVETDDPSAKARLIIGGHIGFKPDGRVALKHGKTPLTSDARSRDDYWTPGATLTAVRHMCSHAAIYGHVLTSRDLSTAYLQTITNETKSFIQLPLDDSIVSYLPETVRAEIDDLRARGVPDKFIVFPVVASLYGIPSAGYSYWKALEEHLTKRGWSRVESDGGALWLKGSMCLCTYVDDLLLSCPKERYAQVWRDDVLAGRWVADDQEYSDSCRYLGLNIHRTPEKGFILEQEEYSHNIAKMYTTMTGQVIKPRQLLVSKASPDAVSPFPADTNGHVCDDPHLLSDIKTLTEGPPAQHGMAMFHDVDDAALPTHRRAQLHTVHAMARAYAAGRRPDKEKCPYHSTVGALMYCARGTRPDVTWATQKCAEAIHEWKEEDTKRLESILGFLLTHSRGLHFPALPKGTSAADLRPVSYTDSNYLAPTSRSGVLHTIQSISLTGETARTGRGGFTHVLDWTSRKQKYAALSSAEAETVALNLGARFVNQTTESLTQLFRLSDQFHVPYILCDSASAIAAVRRGWSRTLSNSSRAVGIAVTWLNGMTTDDRFRLRWISGLDNPADSLTKAVPRTKCRLVPLMAIKSPKNGWQVAEARDDGARYVTKTTQPAWAGGIGPCFSCAERHPLCHKCKCCALCGCACAVDTSPHPLVTASDELQDPQTLLDESELPVSLSVLTQPQPIHACSHTAAATHSDTVYNFDSVVDALLH